MILRREKLALVATGKENDINLQTLTQVVDFASVGMNAASVGDEFRMLLKRVTFESSRRRRRRRNNYIKNQGEKKENKKITFSSRQTFKSKQEPFLHILHGKNDYN